MIFSCPFLHCKALRTAMYKRYINSTIIVIIIITKDSLLIVSRSKKFELKTQPMMGWQFRDTALINGRFRLKDIAYVWWEFQVLLKKRFYRFKAHSQLITLVADHWSLLSSLRALSKSQNWPAGPWPNQTFCRMN